MACQASACVAKGLIVSSGRPPSGGLRLVIRGRRKVLSFWKCLCFIFLTITVIGCVGAMWKDPMFTTVFFTNTLPSAPGTEWGARRHNRGFLRGGPAAARLSPFLFLLAGWTAGGAALTGCLISTILGWLGLDRLGRKCCIAWDDFCAAEKRSVKPSTAGPNRPVGETGESRKWTYLHPSSPSGLTTDGTWAPLNWPWICCGRLLPSSQWPWVGRDARPRTHPGEAGSHILFHPRCRPKWGQRKKRHVAVMSRLHAKIWWSYHGPLGRMAKLIDEGPGDAPARTIHPGGYGTVPLGKTIPNPAPPKR